MSSKSRTRDYTGLLSLCEAWKQEAETTISPVEVVHRIRQVSIGKGCAHACSHCFAAPSSRTRQMNLSSFKRLAGEMGCAVEESGRPLDFCYLGAETDIAVICGGADYLEAWFDALPRWQHIKLYTHGWVLGAGNQSEELAAVLEVLKAYSSRLSVLGLSVDSFSAFAQASPAGYVANAAANLHRFLKALPLEKLKLQVTYPPSRLDLEDLATLRHHTRRMRSGAATNDLATGLTNLLNGTHDADEPCAELTRTVFEIGTAAGLSSIQTLKIAHDNGPAFPAGRGERFYTKRPAADGVRAIDHQRHTCLKPLHGCEHGFIGMVVDVDGSVALVNYLGYRILGYLNEGRQILPYITCSPPQPRPWSGADLRTPGAG